MTAHFLHRYSIEQQRVDVADLWCELTRNDADSEHVGGTAEAGGIYDLSNRFR